MIDAAGLDSLLRLLRAEPGFGQAEFARPPEPLTGGFWASMYLLHLAAAPAELLVLRIMPDDRTAAKEAVFQREIAGQGFPTPAIRLAAGREAGLGGSFLVMDHAQGQPLLASLDGLAALRQLPSIARSLPVLLGQVTARLHALNPAPVRAALDQLQASAPADAPALLVLLAAAAAEFRRADLAAAVSWLQQHPPPPGPEVLCHGDVHPFNLLADAQHWTLIDWTTALITDPAYDLAFTLLILRHPGLTMPSALRPVISAAGAMLARRFVAAYGAAAGRVPSQAALGWGTSLQALRILLEVEGWRQGNGAASHSGHPWMIIGPAAARHLSRITGTAVAWVW